LDTMSPLRMSTNASAKYFATHRVKVPSGVKLMPHRHPEDRIYTVMSGVFYIGLGDRFDSNRVKAFPPGSVIVRDGAEGSCHRRGYRQ
jgi:hypothetical protein